MTNLSYTRRQKQLEKLLQILGIPATSAVNFQLLNLALTHPSVSAKANYEQLEFVGDAVVRLVAAEVLWDVYPDWKVGEFAAIRSVLVSDRILASLATHYAIEPYLLVTSSDKEGQQSRLADAFEAVLGALYLSTHTLELIRPWLDPHFIKLAKEIRSDPARLNYKAALQEWTQGHFKVLPEYRASENTLGHRSETAEERFSAQVWLQDRQIGQGKGRSIKAAEQAAAQMAFRALSQQEE